MRVVIADTSPINYLVLIDAIDVLPRLYDRIVVPSEVLAELTDPGTPEKVVEWIRQKPEWLEAGLYPPRQTLRSKDSIPAKGRPSNLLREKPTYYS